jgi:hypothetical protein
MGIAILIAAGAGLASALLAAAAAAGPGLSMLLSVLAPLPLMIVAFGWHPLMAVLGGAITAAALAAMIRGSAGVVFAVLVMLPAFLAAHVIWRPDLDGAMKTGLLCVGAAFYAVAATLAGAFSISFDHAGFEEHLLRQSELVFRLMSGLARDAPLEPVRGQDPKLFIQTYAQLVAPISTLALGLIYLVNIWLAVRITEASGRFPVARPPASAMEVPKVLLPFAAITLLGGMLPGYIGLASELFAVASILALTALGFAAVHAITVGKPGRPLILTGLWVLTLVFGLPMLAMLFVGIAELAFGWRARKRSGPMS